MKKIWPICLLVLIFSACSNDAVFDQPQPPDSKALLSFPARLRGTYSKENELSRVEIGPDRIVETNYFRYRGPRSKMDTLIFEFHHDTLYNKVTDQVQDVTYNGDTMNIKMVRPHTIFRISEKNVLKTDKGYYFLNEKAGDRWSVRILSLSNGMLVFGCLKDSNEIKMLKTLSEDAEDSGGHRFKPTQKQFEKFVKQKGFQERDTFYRFRPEPKSLWL